MHTDTHREPPDKMYFNTSIDTQKDTHRERDAARETQREDRRCMLT